MPLYAGNGDFERYHKIVHLCKVQPWNSMRFHSQLTPKRQRYGNDIFFFFFFFLIYKAKLQIHFGLGF